jgi:hypothetical protein
LHVIEVYFIQDYGFITLKVLFQIPADLPSEIFTPEKEKYTFYSRMGGPMPSLDMCKKLAHTDFYPRPSFL